MHQWVWVGDFLPYVLCLLATCGLSSNRNIAVCLGYWLSLSLHTLKRSCPHLLLWNPHSGLRRCSRTRKLSDLSLLVPIRTSQSALNLLYLCLSEGTKISRCFFMANSSLSTWLLILPLLETQLGNLFSSMKTPLPSWWGMETINVLLMRALTALY